MIPMVRLRYCTLLGKISGEKIRKKRKTSCDEVLKF